MKYLGAIQDNKDLVTKEYVDNQIETEIDKIDHIVASMDSDDETLILSYSNS